MYKTKLPFLVAFNKTDVTSHKFAVEWMKDFEVFAVLYSSFFFSLIILLNKHYYDLNKMTQNVAECKVHGVFNTLLTLLCFVLC